MGGGEGVRTGGGQERRRWGGGWVAPHAVCASPEVEGGVWARGDVDVDQKRGRGDVDEYQKRGRGRREGGKEGRREGVRLFTVVVLSF